MSSYQIHIEKSNRKFRGVASIPKYDSENEKINLEESDYQKFKWINWNHLGNQDPRYIIGEITNHKINENGELEIEGELHEGNPLADAVVSLAEDLSESNIGNTLTLSIEGKGIETIENQDGTKDTKMSMFGAAITPTPVNDGTWVEITKSEKYDILELDKEKKEEEEEKKEDSKDSKDNKSDKEGKDKEDDKRSEEKKEKKEKSQANYTDRQIYSTIFKSIPNISQDHARQLLEFVKDLSNKSNMNLNDDIIKGYSVLEQRLNIQKSASGDEKKKGQGENFEGLSLKDHPYSQMKSDSKEYKEALTEASKMVSDEMSKADCDMGKVAKAAMKKYGSIGEKAFKDHMAKSDLSAYYAAADQNAQSMGTDTQKSEAADVIKGYIDEQHNRTLGLLQNIVEKVEGLGSKVDSLESDIEDIGQSSAEAKSIQKSMIGHPFDLEKMNDVQKSYNMAYLNLNKPEEKSRAIDILKSAGFDENVMTGIAFGSHPDQILSDNQKTELLNKHNIVLIKG